MTTTNAPTSGSAYAEKFRKVGKDFVGRQKLYQKVVDEENGYRELFAQQRDSPKIADPHLMMVAAHKEEDIFKALDDTSEEASIPKVFDLGANKRAGGEPTIVNESDFKRNFDVFTEGQLRYLDWNNVFVAGGSVLACLQPIPSVNGEPITNKRRREYYHKQKYKNSDIDIFIYGLTEEQANEKIKQIFHAVCEAIPVEVIAFRSTHAITLVSQYPYRHIQLILRLYKSPAEVLMGFDVDCCAVGYDGDKVWMVPRAHRALVTQANCIDLTRRSPSYEMRLAKYSSRGFAVAVPGLQRNRIDPQLFERRFDKLQGLAKLLLLEKLTTPEARTKFKEQQRLKRLRPEFERQGSFWQQLSSKFANDEYLRERAEDGGADASDYSTVFLPWGPKWDAKKVQKLMYTKDCILNSKWYDPKKKIHTHPCFFGTIEEVMKDCCGHCPPNPDEDPDSPFVSGPIKWVTVDPGRQSIGSFHPITDGDWTEGAYISVLTEKICLAVNGNDVKQVQQLIDDGVNLESKDAAGRTPLLIGAFSNSVESCELLLKNKAWISSRTSDGRTALHVAAAYGHTEILKKLIERGKQVLIENEQVKAEKEAAKKEKEEKRAAKKARGSDEDEDMDEEEEEGGDEDEDEDMDGDGDGDNEDGEGAKKDQEQPEEEETDKFEIDAEDWDMKMSPLMYAVYFGRTDCVRILLDNGASIEKLLVYKRENQPCSTYTILHLASINNSVQVAKLLLERGALLNQLDLGLNTPLHKVVQAQKVEFVKLFLEYKGTTPKANVNLLNNALKSPLLIASSVGNIEIVKLLLQNGAHVDITDQDVQKYNQAASLHYNATQTAKLLMQPLHAAAQSGNIELIKLLLDHKANPNAIWNSGYRCPLDIIYDAIESLEQEHAVTSQQRERVKQAKAAGPNSYEYFAISVILKGNYYWGYSHQQSRKKTPQELETEAAEKKKKQEDLKRNRKCLELLKKHNAKRFHELELKENETELAQQQRYARQRLRNRSSSSFGFGCGRDERHVFRYSSIPPATGGSYGSQYDESLQADYHKLFVAAWNGDIKTIDRLTLNAKDTTSQLRVCSQCTSTHMTPLHAALAAGQTETAAHLIKIAAEQYTPEPEEERGEEEETKIPVINNYDLAATMHIKPKHYLGDYQLKRKSAVRDPNKPAQNIICLTDPGTLIKHTSNNQLTAIHVGAQKGHAATIRSVLQALRDLPADKIYRPKRQPNAELHPKQQQKHQQQPQDIVVELLLMQDSNKLTAFDRAIIYGHVEAAKVLLEFGGLNLPEFIIGAAAAAQADDDEDSYEGLDVGGGKKAEWAREHRAPVKNVNKSPFTVLHLAAAHNQVACIDFLLSGDADKALAAARAEIAKRQQATAAAAAELDINNNAADNKAKVGSKRGRALAVEMEGDTKKGRMEEGVEMKAAADEPTIPEKQFKVTDVDKFGNTALHYAVSKGNLEAVKALLRNCQSNCEEKRALLNAQNTNQGITALHLAARLGYKDIVSYFTAATEGLRGLLDFDIKDKARGFTALHWAAMNNEDEVLDVLLQCPDLKNKDPTAEDGHRADCARMTPLMIAAEKGHIACLRVMLHRGCDAGLRDFNGEYPLHLAAKGGFKRCVKMLLDTKYYYKAGSAPPPSAEKDTNNNNNNNTAGSGSSSSSKEAQQAPPPVWYWACGANQWKEYSAAEIKAIEAGYQKWLETRGEASEEVNINSEYRANFLRSIQYRIADPTRVRKIKREPAAETNPKKPKNNSSGNSSSKSESKSNKKAMTIAITPSVVAEENAYGSTPLDCIMNKMVRPIVPAQQGTGYTYNPSYYDSDDEEDYNSDESYESDHDNMQTVKSSNDKNKKKVTDKVDPSSCCERLFGAYHQNRRKIINTEDVRKVIDEAAARSKREVEDAAAAAAANNNRYDSYDRYGNRNDESADDITLPFVVEQNQLALQAEFD